MIFYDKLSTKKTYNVWLCYNMTEFHYMLVVHMVILIDCDEFLVESPAYTLMAGSEETNKNGRTYQIIWGRKILGYLFFKCENKRFCTLGKSESHIKSVYYITFLKECSYIWYQLKTNRVLYDIFFS